MFSHDGKMAELKTNKQQLGNMPTNNLLKKETRLAKFEKNKMLHPKYSSTSKRLPKTKTAEGPRINK